MASLYSAMLCSLLFTIFFFFFTDTATTEIYTLSLHDALPIFAGALRPARRAGAKRAARPRRRRISGGREAARRRVARRPADPRRERIRGRAHEPQGHPLDGPGSAPRPGRRDARGRAGPRPRGHRLR